MDPHFLSLTKFCKSSFFLLPFPKSLQTPSFMWKMVGKFEIITRPAIYGETVMSTLPTLTCLHVAPLHRSLHQTPNLFHLSPIFWHAGHQSALNTTIHSPSRIYFQSGFYRIPFLFVFWAEEGMVELLEVRAWIELCIQFGVLLFFFKKSWNNSLLKLICKKRLGYWKNLFPIVVINLNDTSSDTFKTKGKNNATCVK